MGRLGGTRPNVICLLRAISGPSTFNKLSSRNAPLTSAASTMLNQIEARISTGRVRGSSSIDGWRDQPRGEDAMAFVHRDRTVSMQFLAQLHVARGERTCAG